MGKKIRAEMDAQRETFTKGAIEQGFTPQKAVEVFELMAKFADYGFNKSHAAAYALVSYQTAYLRANHPVEFLAACMSLAIDNTDKLAVLKQDSARLGIKLLPPDINKSGADFSPETLPDGTRAIRYALGAIKRVGFAAMRQLVAERDERGEFKDLTDFVHRINPSVITRAQIEILAKAGAFDNLPEIRKQRSAEQQVMLKARERMLAAAESIVKHAQSAAEERESGQIGLFGGGEPEPFRLPDAAGWPEQNRLAMEAEAIGFHISAHPLDMYGAALRRLDVVASTQIERRAQAGGGRMRLAGTLGAKKERITRTGSRMMWITLSDMAGSFEVTLFSEVLNRVRELLTEGTALLVTADIKMETEALRITATDVALLDAAAAQAGAGLRVWLDRTEALPHIRALLDREGKGKGRVTLVPKTGLARDLDIVLPGGFNVSPKLAQAMKLVPGVELVEDV
jgi:DNA polymerase-3 subunit alpha